MRSIALLCAALLAAPFSASAQSPDLPRNLHLAPADASPLWAGSSAGHQELPYSPQIDGAVVVVTGGLWILTESLKAEMAPASCLWCSHNGLDDAVTAALAWPDIKLAATVGNITGFVLTPLVTAGTLAIAANHDGHLDDFWVNSLVMVEAVTVSSLLNQAVKYSVGRERPFVSELSPADKAKTADPADNNLSFYSGHSNLAFALAISAGTIAHIRGYQYEPLVWGVGVPLASFVAYSRIAAKKHYFTDVLVGSAAGAAFGFAIPWFFHRPKGGTSQTSSALTVSPLPNGAAFTLLFD